ncbi:uncharacterized protein LOC134181961 isoform X3 [Corticium candelabrum]|uniref:uncharacterized protein LOC134181961 isoform X3 n=1 Tax=Corticium candelabrum TaxID=121492 RepID=UPI002E270CAC|nr:uncharacterized protein LOC134181961 isoform X3 [Corticium candelabrum]
MQERDEDNKRLQNQISRPTNQLDNKEKRLQQQGGEIDVLRHEVQEKHTTNERLARDLQRRERAMQELERLQHQYDSVIQIHDDSLHMTGLKLGTGAYGEQAALLSESEDVKKRDDRQSCEVTQQIEKEAAQKEEANYRNDAANVIQLHSKSEDDSQPSSFNLREFKMELDEVKSITLDLGNGKYVKLFQTFSIKQIIGAQGDILSCPRGDQMILIPSGALQSDTEIEVTFYRVVESVGLDSSEFVTNLMEITPHQLNFKKSVEILMRHHLFIEGDSTKVTVLFHSAKPTDSSFTSLCQLSSVNDTALANFMTMSLWEDFVYIETSHICRFGLHCKDKSLIEVWASFHTPKIPHPEQHSVTLCLSASRPDPSDEKFIHMAGGELECRYSTLLPLVCEEQEDLHVTVRIPSDMEGWKAREDLDLSQTISYKSIRNLVVLGMQYISTDFGFIKEKTSKVDVMDFAPIFMLNNIRCILLPSAFQTSDSGAISSGNQQTNVPEPTVVADGTFTSLSDSRHAKALDRISPGSKSLDTSTTSLKQDVSLSLPVSAGLGWNCEYIGLNRPVTDSDIDFLSGYDQVAKKSLQIGWLLLQDDGYSMKDINVVMKDVLDQPDCVKVTYIIEEWRRRRNEATARTLVDVCCHQSVGGDRSYIEHSLMFSSHSHSASHDEHYVHSAVEASAPAALDSEFCAATGNDSCRLQLPLLADRLKNAAQQGHLGGFIRPWCDIPVRIVLEVSHLSAWRPSALGVHLGVSAHDLSTVPDTNIPSERVYNMIDFWIERDGKEATLTKLLEAVKGIGKLGELEGRVTADLP